MMVETPVVEIDGAHRRHLIIAQHALGMEESRCILINSHTRLNQILVIGLGKSVNHLLVRYAGRHNAHIHAPLCRQF